MSKTTKEFLKKLVPASGNGIPIKECQPFEVYARAIEVNTEQIKRETITREDHYSMISKTITFEFEIDKKTYTAKQTFISGQIAPELGGWVRAIAVQNQFFSMQISVTHLMRVRII